MPREKLSEEERKRRKAARQKVWYVSNKEVVAARDKAYRAANNEAVAARKKANYEANKDTIAARNKAYYEANKEAAAARTKAWREANKETEAARMKAYYEANKEAILASQRVDPTIKARRVILSRERTAFADQLLHAAKGMTEYERHCHAAKIMLLSNMRPDYKAVVYHHHALDGFLAHYVDDWKHGQELGPYPIAA